MIKLSICCLVLFIENLIVGQSVDIIKFVKYDNAPLIQMVPVNYSNIVPEYQTH